MTIEQLRKVYESEPFRPFVLHLADSREIPVMHREFMAMSPSGRTVTVYDADDTSNIIDLLLVVSIELKAVTNGSGKRRKR